MRRPRLDPAPANENPAGRCIRRGANDRLDTMADCGQHTENPMETQAENGAAGGFDAGTFRSTAPVYPPGFSMRESGDHAGLRHTEIDKDGEPIETWIGPPLFVLGQTRDADSKSWGLLLFWQDPDGEVHSWAMPKSMLEGDPAEYRKRLADEGWSPAPNQRARAKLAEFLAGVKSESRVRCVPRTGWHGAAYVFPDETIDDEVRHE